MSESNSDKFKHGSSAQSGLKSLLSFCKEQGFICDYIDEFRTGREGFSEKQFYAPFLIIFVGEVKWALFSTTSMRTDRIKGQQWDSINLKEIDENIQKCYLVFPDNLSEKEESEFKRQQAKILNKYEYSAIDGIVNQHDLYLLIEKNATKDKTSGQLTDLKGNVFEKRVADILSNKDNFAKWKNSNDLIVGLNYYLFKKIVSFFSFSPESTVSISATCDKKIIGKLNSRGNPKTDILLTIDDLYGKTETFTISCKRTSASSVSVHQYTADSFCKVLDPQNEKLRILLNEFQRVGNLRDFGEENILKLTKELELYKEKLAMWVFGGIGGDGNPTTQWAKYLLTYKNETEEYDIHTIEEYYNILVSKGMTGQFGTVFSWTFASKQRGKSIQLKSRII